ncbi:MAG: hypothetical protein M1826_002286 [Phylliscum demangeonii]|nr:MAG: hypothetical protein M1826_002286 [Phylliscum demangeonii]
MAQQVSAQKQQELQLQYSSFKNHLQQLAQKIGDIEQEAEEHKLVLETLDPLPADRKCFRLINGVLVQRTVKDVVPAVKTNADGLRTVLDDLLKQYKERQTEMEKWKRRNHVQVLQQ